MAKHTFDAEILEVVKTNAINAYEYREDNGIENCGPDFAEAAYEIINCPELAAEIDEILTTRMLRARGGI
jgi:hypothetical protein